MNRIVGSPFPSSLLSGRTGNGWIDRPERINSDPYGAWLFTMRPERPADVDALLDAGAYRQIVDAAK